MFLGEPAPTQADLHFRLFGWRVRISPFFWVAALLLGWRASDGEPRQLLIWVAAVFVSILVHEMGHAMAFRYFGIDCHMVLYHFGGLAVPDNVYQMAGFGPRSEPKQQIIISFAGPLAGFMLAGFVVAVLYAIGVPVVFYFDPQYLISWEYQAPLPSEAVLYLVHDMIYIGLFWGIVNLIPIYPLDGGQIARQLMILAGMKDAIRNSLILSVAAAVAVAVWALTREERSFFMVIMFGMLAYSSYSMLSNYHGRGGGGFGGGGYGGGRPW